MRNNFVKQIITSMEADPSIVFLTGDLGYNALEAIAKQFPKRFYNIGIAEQNMIGIAAGLALSGHKVITYSIASFITMRCYEQIRHDLCYHNLDVKIIGTGGGFNYSHNGVTHHTVEDLAIMSALPKMKVLCPSYSWEADEATKAILVDRGPAYLRLGKSPGIAYQKSDWKFKLGQGYMIKPGKDLTLFLTGNITDIAFAAAAIIEKKTKFKVCLVSLPTVKPLDRQLIIKQAKISRGIFTLEEHGLIGGLGSAISAVLAEAGLATRFKSFGLRDEFVKLVGTREYLCEAAGIGPAQIAKEIIKLMTNAR
jgi:transketolase